MFKKISAVILFLNVFAISLYAQKDCPQITVLGPAGVVKKGEVMTFMADVQYVDEKYVRSYSWLVSKGKIIEGQGTKSIKVDTGELSGEDTVIATFTINLDEVLNTCSNMASEAGVIEPMPEPRLVDEYGNLPCDDQMARLDNYFMELQNDPSAMGYVFHFGSEKAVAIADRQKRSYMKVRNMPTDRIIFVNGGQEKIIRTQFWVVPAGAEPPMPESMPEDDAKVDEKVPDETVETVERDPKEPYIFASEYYDGYSCYGEEPEFDIEGYAEYLKENPKSRGNIVITLMTKKDFREKEKEILDFLKSKGIAKKRLRTFYVNGFGGVELWILP